MASAAANGNIVRSVPLVTLDGAKRRLAAISAIVATLTVTRPRDSSLLDPRGTESFDSLELAVGVDVTKLPIVTFELGVHK
jgi:hypothetical protein